MHPQPDEKELIQYARQGDVGALGMLYERYVSSVYRFMFYRTGDEMVAEDLTAEVFAHVISAIQRYEERGIPFRAWLFRIARARLADYWRRVKRWERHDALLTGRDPSEWLSSVSLDDRFKYEEVRRAFDYLTASEREVVLLRFVGDLSNEEIAAVVHSNANAVKSKMRRALDKMKQVLERQAAFHEGRVD